VEASWEALVDSISYGLLHRMGEKGASVQADDREV